MIKLIWFYNCLKAYFYIVKNINSNLKRLILLRSGENSEQAQWGSGNSIRSASKMRNGSFPFQLLLASARRLYRETSHVISIKVVINNIIYNNIESLVTAGLKSIGLQHFWCYCWRSKRIWAQIEYEQYKMLYIINSTRVSLFALRIRTYLVHNCISEIIIEIPDFIINIFKSEILRRIRVVKLMTSFKFEIWINSILLEILRMIIL